MEQIHTVVSSESTVSVDSLCDPQQMPQDDQVFSSIFKGGPQQIPQHDQVVLCDPQQMPQDDQAVSSFVCDTQQIDNVVSSEIVSVWCDPQQRVELHGGPEQIPQHDQDVSLQFLCDPEQMPLSTCPPQMPELCESPQQRHLLTCPPQMPELQADFIVPKPEKRVELQRPLVSSKHSDLSSNYSQQQQQHQVEAERAIDIKKLIEDCGDGRLLQDCCIYRVPITLRKNKEKVYTPKVISIGPFHYGLDGLQDMERHKQTLFKRFTERTNSSLDDLIHFIKHLEPKVRDSYSETINLDQQRLVNLTLIDAAFIIEFFLAFLSGGARNDAKLSQPWLADSILKDLILLENQLPFFVIQGLFDKAFPHSSRSFLDLTYGCFAHYNNKKLKPNPRDEIKHFTDLVRLFHVQGKQYSERCSFSDDVRSNILLYNLNALQEAGIKLKVGESKCLLDLKFSGGILEIPKIEVVDSTELLLGNLIALEQCHYPRTSYIADYALLLDWLIDTNKDVDLLVHNKIVRNYIGDANNIALLFNGLSEHVVHSTFSREYRDICKRLNDYYQGCWHKTRATLRRKYCSTPWQVLGSIAGILLLLLTIAQTIFSILQVV